MNRKKSYGAQVRETNDVSPPCNSRKMVVGELMFWVLPLGIAVPYYNYILYFCFYLSVTFIQHFHIHHEHIELAVSTFYSKYQWQNLKVFWFLTTVLHIKFNFWRLRYEHLRRVYIHSRSPSLNNNGNWKPQKMCSHEFSKRNDETYSTITVGVSD